MNCSRTSEINNRQYQYFMRTWIKRVSSYKPLRTCHQRRISSESWKSTVCLDNSVSSLTGIECQPIRNLKCSKEKQSLSESGRCLLRATCGEKQIQEEGERERRSERARERGRDEKKMFPLYTTQSVRHTSCCSPHSGWLWQDTVCAAFPLCVIDEPHFAN